MKLKLLQFALTILGTGESLFGNEPLSCKQACSILVSQSSIRLRVYVALPSYTCIKEIHNVMRVVRLTISAKILVLLAILALLATQEQRYYYIKQSRHRNSY